MFTFLLANPNNVVCVNCNAGKGRTGTAISCFQIYSHLTDNFIDAITYYGWKDSQLEEEYHNQANKDTFNILKWH